MEPRFRHVERYLSPPFMPTMAERHSGRKWGQGKGAPEKRHEDEDRNDASPQTALWQKGTHEVTQEDGVLYEPMPEGE